MLRSLPVAASLIIATLTTTTIAAPLTRSAVMTTDDGVRYQAVRFGDLDSTSVRGNQMLYRRLMKSAEVVCQQRTLTRPTFRSDLRRCRDTALARAVQAIGRAPLTELHRAAKADRRVRG